MRHRIKSCGPIFAVLLTAGPSLAIGGDGPSYRVVAAMVELAKREEYNSLRASVHTLGPSLDHLDSKYREDLAAQFEEAVATHNRDSAIESTILLATLQAREAVETAHRDELTGWKDARLTAAAAYLNYDAVASEAKSRFPAQDQEVRRAFFQFASILKAIDLTSDSAGVDSAKASLLSKLGNMSKAIAARRSPRK